MQHIYVAETSMGTDNTPIVEFRAEISQSELNEINDNFIFTGTHYRITEIKNIVVENGEEFKKWMNSSNLQQCRDRGFKAERMILLSNKFVLNYVSSIKTYIDIESRLLNEKTDKKERFLSLTHNFYDQHMEYRFWVNFRNYVVHCSLPYTVFQEVEGKQCQVICTREHLLEFKNWKHSKEDIEKMPEQIDLVSMVDTMSSFIYALYLDFYASFSQEIADGIAGYGKFCRKYDVKQPVIIKTNAPLDVAHGKMHPLPVHQLYEAFQVLKQNPKVEIRVEQ